MDAFSGTRARGTLALKRRRITPFPPGFDKASFLSEANIVSELHYAKRRQGKCAPFLMQVPWGKHNPLEWRGSHYADYFEGVDVDEVLPVVVVKDPLTWMRSMCRMEYAAKFRHGQAQCCPHPVMKTATDVRFRRERPAFNYTSLPDFWSKWNDAYHASAIPRLMVRYEDLLWRTRETTKRVCDCVGGRMTETFDPIAQSAKGGAGHGFHETGRNSATAKYGNETKRYEFLTDADVTYVADHADPRFMAQFHYGVSARRRRAASPGAKVCKPDRNVWLHSVGLKSSPAGPVPLDDESDGVLVNGFFYPNPKKPRTGNVGSRLRNAVRKAEEQHGGGHKPPPVHHHEWAV